MSTLIKTLEHKITGLKAIWTKSQGSIEIYDDGTFVVKSDFYLLGKKETTFQAGELAVVGGNLNADDLHWSYGNTLSELKDAPLLASEL